MVFFTSLKNSLTALKEQVIRKWEVINNRLFKDVDKITIIKSNQNEKILILGTYNGKIYIIHAFTFEILLTGKSLEENFIHLHI